MRHRCWAWFWLVDDETGCAISIESAEEILDWESQGRIATNPIQAIGLLLAIQMVPITPIAT